MPRNGSGQFVLPPSNPVVPDTLIATSWANPTLTDIAAAISTSIATDGQTPPTANLPMATWRHTNVGAALGPLQYARADQVQGWGLNIVTSVAADGTGTAYTGTVPFGVGNGSVLIPTLMPLEFVPSVNNGGPSTLALNGGPAVSILNSNLTQLSAGQIRAGRPYALTYLAGNWILLTNTIELTQLNGLYVQLNGAVPMTGPLTLSQDPSQPMHAATAQWVQSQITGSVSGVSSFNTRIGAVTLLSSDVTTALSYTPFNAAGGTIGGNVTVNGGVTGGGFLADRYKVNTQVLTPAAGATVNLLPVSGRSSYVIDLTAGNITITIEAGMLPGNVLRIVFYATAGRSVTWPANVFWPMPVQTPPVIDSGSIKRCIVAISLDHAGAYLANASVY